MSHLDRLASPHQLPLSNEIDFQGCKSNQSILWAGQVSWNIFMDYSINDEGNFGVSNLLGKNFIFQSEFHKSRPTYVFLTRSSEKYKHYTKIFDTQQEYRNVVSGFHYKRRRFLH